MNIGQAVSSGFKKYATFSGRARRSEFWWFTLVVYVLAVVLPWVLIAPYFADAFNTGSGDLLNFGPGLPVGVVLFLALIVPTIAVSSRRLQDTGKNGALAWLILLGGIGGLGHLIVAVLCIPAGDPGDNAYGPSPQ